MAEAQKSNSEGREDEAQVMGEDPVRDVVCCC